LSEEKKKRKKIEAITEFTFPKLAGTVDH